MVKRRQCLGASPLVDVQGGLYEMNVVLVHAVELLFANHAPHIGYRLLHLSGVAGFGPGQAGEEGGVDPPGIERRPEGGVGGGRHFREGVACLCRRSLHPANLAHVAPALPRCFVAGHLFEILPIGAKRLFVAPGVHEGVPALQPGAKRRLGVHEALEMVVRLLHLVL